MNSDNFNFLNGNVKIVGIDGPFIIFEEIFQSGLAQGEWKSKHFDSVSEMNIKLKYENGIVNGQSSCDYEENECKLSCLIEYSCGKLIIIKLESNSTRDFKLSDFLCKNSEKILTLKERLIWFKENINLTCPLLLKFGDDESLVLDKKTLELIFKNFYLQ